MERHKRTGRRGGADAGSEYSGGRRRGRGRRRFYLSAQKEMGKTVGRMRQQLAGRMAQSDVMAREEG